MTNTLAEITTWHQRARPNPTAANFGVQLGCHLEEISEMLGTLMCNDSDGDFTVLRTFESIETLANLLKAGEIHAVILPSNREAFLDSLADQIVTAVGVGHCANMDVTEACLRVNESNWSKFDGNGQPIFNEHGKVKKGPNYVQPDLFGLF